MGDAVYDAQFHEFVGQQMQSPAPTAFTGSVTLPGEGLVLVNVGDDLFDAGGWNTLSVEVRHRRVAVWLNGGEVGAVRIAGPGKG